MNHDHSQHEHSGDPDQPSTRPWVQRGHNWVLLCFIAIAAFLLLMEHRAHLTGILPWLIILAICPLMHIFMHGGHGMHGGQGQKNKDTKKED